MSSHVEFAAERHHKHISLDRHEGLRDRCNFLVFVFTERYAHSRGGSRESKHIGRTEAGFEWDDLPAFFRYHDWGQNFRVKNIL